MSDNALIKYHCQQANCINSNDLQTIGVVYPCSQSTVKQRKCRIQRDMCHNDLRRFGLIITVEPSSPQPLGIDMGVDLGGGHVLMPKCLLDKPYVACAVVKQGRERMTEGMR